MQVILLEKIQNLGNLGDTVKVKPGYGRNFLIPTGKAVPATEASVAEFEARRAELEKVQADALEHWINAYCEDPEFGGFLVWNIGDCWPQQSDAIIDYLGNEKLFLKRLYPLYEEPEY